MGLKTSYQLIREREPVEVTYEMTLRFKTSDPRLAMEQIRQISTCTDALVKCELIAAGAVPQAT